MIFAVFYIIPLEKRRPLTYFQLLSHFPHETTKVQAFWAIFVNFMDKKGKTCATPNFRSLVSFSETAGKSTGVPG
jgi:hypothetical protein